MKTAFAFLMMGGVLAQDGYVAPGPVDPPKGSVDGPYKDAPPQKPVEPPPYDGGAVDPDPVDPPAPVDPPKDGYDDVPPPPPDYEDDDEYVDDSDEDEYTDVPAPTDVYDDGHVDDDDDYDNGAPAPDTGYSPAPAPVPKPAPVYEAPAQKECGALYVDVIKTVLEKILGNIDKNVIDHIVNLLQQLLGYVKDLDPSNPASLAKVVEHVNQIAVYCDANIPDINDDAKHFVVKAFSEMKDTYGSVYDTAVDTHVYDAWEHLWNSCKTSPDSAHASDYVDQYYKAYSGYLKDGPASPAYQADIDHLCTSPDETVSKYANDTKTAIKTLSQEANDGSQPVDSSASTMYSTMLTVLFATVAGSSALFL